MRAEKIESSYQLSPMQQGMLFHSLLARHSGVYIQQMCCALRERLDVPAFVSAWERAAARHEVLRTSFRWGGVEGPLQLVHERVEVPFEQHDWRSLAPEAQEKRLDEYVAQDRRLGFEPERVPLMRLALFRMADADYRLIWTSHHALFDGRARLLLLREVFDLYRMLREGREPQLPTPRPYSDFIEWLRGRDLSAAEAFWREELKCFNTPTPVGAAARGAATDGRHAARELRLSAGDTSALRSFALRHGLSFNTMLQGAWALLLSRYAGVEDVVFGTTRAGRQAALEGADSIVGLLINTVPVRVRVEPDASLLPWLKGLRARNVRLREFEHTPLVRIQEWSEVPAGRPLFESLIVFENYQLNDLLRSDGGEWSDRDFRLLEQTDYPLVLLGYGGDELLLKLAYSRDRFEDDDAVRMLGQLHTLLLGMASGEERRLCELTLLTEAERRRVLYEWNDTETPFARETCVHELFEAQVRRSPDALAVVDGRERLTYQELDSRADRLARRLRRLGVGPDSLVALLVERSPLAVVSILAVLKAGGAYLPLDPEYPRERLAFMLEDSRAKLLLTVRRLAERAGAAGGDALLLDEVWDEVEDEETGGGRAARPENLAYVIYTSGSTGRPKGVMIHHRGLCNLSAAQIRAFDLRPGRQVLQFASFSFDASASEIFTTLLSGATLHLADRDSLMPGTGLVRLLRERGITTVTFPPTVLASLSPADVPGLQTIISAGEMCPSGVAEVYCNSGRRFLNAYGPTETTVCATISYATATSRHASIGRPISNVQVYVLDARLEPAPPGVPGELYVGGAGLARGYLGRPALTAERFVPNAFSGEHGALLYRTGDAARYLTDGSVEFIGRLDQQVKLRGFRIELGEVEESLRRHPSVRDAAVIVREDDARDARLVAYFTARGAQEEAPMSSELRQHLASELPEYMVPSAFVLLERLPLTAAGKVDRRALPAPGPSRPDLKAPYAAPRTPTEELLASVWGQVLGVERVGVNDTFFDLGGHSLLAAQIASRAQEFFKVELPLSAFFESPTVAGMAERVEAATRRGQKFQTPPIRRRTGHEDLPLSFAQQRLWLLDQLQPGSPAYNIPKFLRLRGHLDVPLLEHSLNEVVRRHEALRTTFESRHGSPLQRIHPAMHVPLPVTDLSHLPPAEREAEAARLLAEEARRPFDLAAGPLMRASLIRLSDEEHAFTLTLHHIISDGWSLGVLLRELSVLYAAGTRGEESPLPDLPIQYADYALWQRSWLRGEALDRRLSYWRDRLSGAPEVLSLPADRARPAAAGWAGDAVRFDVSPQVADALRREARKRGVTLFMLLLSAFKVLLWRHSGEADISVGTPAAGRDRMEVEGLIGFFVNTLVLRTKVEGKESFSGLVARVREACLGAYQHQEVPFEKLVEELALSRSLAHAPLFQVMFTMGGQEPQLELGEVRAEPWEVMRETTKFDLTCGVSERAGGGMWGGLQFSTELFEAGRMRAMARRWERLLEAVATGFDGEVWQLPMLGDEERALLLGEWNEAGSVKTEDEVDDECLHQLFERQASERGEEIALVYEGERLTYQELDSRADRLARRLRRLGVGPDSLVALLVERSSLAVVSILAVLKAGGAYLPLDTSYPRARLAMMLEDARPIVLLATPESARYAAELEGEGGCALEIVGEGSGQGQWSEGEGEDESPHAFESGVRPENLAYVIYTSGSTGRPKGVMIEHRQIVNYVRAVRRRMGVGAGANFALVSTLAADLGHTVLFPSLCSGGTLHVVSQWRTMEARALGEYFQREAIDCVKIVPSHLRALLASGEEAAHVLPRLLLVLGGEAAGWDLLDEVKRLAPHCRVMNHYGPTETTVGTLTHEPVAEAGQPEAARGAVVALGRPLGGTRGYVLDEYLQLVPPGSRGELYLSGAGLARGYLRRPALTAERFLPDPFSSQPGARLYRTGDVCRHLSDGRLEFLGRIDHQVKVRGFRIELGEVEAAVTGYAPVREAVAVVRDDEGGNKRLVAYVVPHDPSAFNVGELRDYLKAQLPGHVVPSAFVLLERLPLTAGGKLDRAALPPPEYTGRQTDSTHSEPRTQTEAVIARIFCQTLGLKQVGVEDNFFELGGHSLLATQVISRVREMLRVELSLRALFEAPTVSGLARLISACEARPGQTETIARLLTRVRRMTPEDARKLLHKDDQP
jgi:amino acid adenylation domain-containing protein